MNRNHKEAQQAVADITKAESRLDLAVYNLRNADGYTWTQIGEVLGTSKQGAQQRFSRYRMSRSGVLYKEPR